MILKSAFRIVLVLALSFTVLPSANAEEEAFNDEDIEEIFEILEGAIGEVLELSGYTIDDLPYQLKYLIAKYYLISMVDVEQPDVFEQIVNDRNIVNDYMKTHNGQQRLAEEFPEYLNYFVLLNKIDNQDALDKFVDEVSKSFDFDLQVVIQSDAVKLLLYYEAYPRIMKVISELFAVHYLEHFVQLMDNDDIDITSFTRAIVALHGRFELVKHLLIVLESHLPVLPTPEIDDSMLDYLDDLKDLLEENSYRLWGFIKGPAYKTITDKWIDSVEAFSRDLLIFLPLHEIIDFVDVVALNATHRRAFMDYRFARETSDRDSRRQLPLNADDDRTAAQNIMDVLHGIGKIVADTAVGVRDVLHDSVAGAQKFSDDDSTDYVDNEVDSDMSIYAPNRFFTRLNTRTEQSLNGSEKQMSIVIYTGGKADDYEATLRLHLCVVVETKDSLPLQELEMNLLWIRKNLEKLRDAVGNIAPVPSDTSHIQLDALLQLIVNKFGSFVFVMEKVLVDLYNSFSEYHDSDQFVKDRVDGMASKLDALDDIFRITGKKTSELLRERVSELEELIDFLVDFSKFK